MIVAIYEAGLSQIVYYCFFGVGFLSTYTFLFWYSKKIGVSLVQVLTIQLLGSGAVLLAMKLLQIVLIPIARILPIMNSYLNNMGRSFIFVPLIALCTSKIVRISWAKVCGLYTFSQTITWGFASLGCLFAGCCVGYPFECGIPHPITGIRLFPTQIVNFMGLLTIAGYVFLRCKKKQYELDGKEYPIMLILVGMLRFFTEFLMDNPKILLGLSSLSFDSLLMIVTGIAILVWINRKN